MDVNAIKILNKYINICEDINILEDAINNTDLKVSIKEANIIDRQLVFMRGYKECLQERIRLNNITDKI